MSLLYREQLVSSGLARPGAAPANIMPKNIPDPLRTRRAAHEMASDEDERGVVRDLVLPIILLVLGLGGRFSQVLFFASQQKLSTPAAIGLLVCELIISAIALTAGALAAATILSATFGDARVAVLKIVAIAAATSAAAYLVASIDREPGGLRGMVLAWHLVLLLYFILFTFLFRLDLQEGLMTTVIVMAAQLVLLFAVSRALPSDAARALFYG